MLVSVYHVSSLGCRRFLCGRGSSWSCSLVYGANMKARICHSVKLKNVAMPLCVIFFSFVWYAGCTSFRGLNVSM